MGPLDPAPPLTSPMMASADHGDRVTFRCESMGGPNNVGSKCFRAVSIVLGVTNIEFFLEGENYSVTDENETIFFTLNCTVNNII